MINLSEDQKRIIEEKGNLVVIANPGSGKTTTIAIKIRNILPKLNSYEGVIAISYTNKAANELKNRVLSYGVDIKKSFFGTIDKFCIEEIIRPFISHIIFDIDKNIDSLEIKKIEDLGYKKSIYKAYLDEERLQISLDYIRKGVIILEDTGLLANYIIANSLACKRYIKARYKYILIDEYQDCDKYQHEIFLKFHELGLISIAIGDVNQSIFEYDNKSSKYLILLSQKSDFLTETLNKNFRCHKSICNYAYKFLGLDIRDKNTEDMRVKSDCILGDESKIAEYIEYNLNKLMEEYDVKKYKEIGILTRSNRTANIINEYMTIPHRLCKDTNLDKNNSHWANIFRDILNCTLGNQINQYDFLNKYFNIKYDFNLVNKVRKNLDFIKNNIKNNDIINKFEEIAKWICNDKFEQSALDDLKLILEDESILNLYRPVKDDEVQIMTIHKSKGLEFDIVFHLDLYKYILPAETKENGVWKLATEQQCKNLHYVAITRAKKLCYLLTSTLRTNRNGQIIDAKPSQYWKMT